MKTSILPALALACASLVLPTSAQVNSGSDGHDGVLNPTANVEIDMADHPDGIYHYTAVNIPAGVTVTFKPNAANTPVVWLAQADCVIAGIVRLDGNNSNGTIGGIGGPGGYRGGNGGGGGVFAGDGLGPGGGKGGDNQNLLGGNGSFSSFGTQFTYSGACLDYVNQANPGSLYGNQFLVPLVGGSGGGGQTPQSTGGGGGGGALLVAANQSIVISGTITSLGGGQFVSAGRFYGGGGTGGAIRLVSNLITGNGGISVTGGRAGWNCGWGYDYPQPASSGFIRLDTFSNSYTGAVAGYISRGFQPIILPPAAQSVALAIQSVAGVAVAAAPAGKLVTPDVIVPAAQQNPVTIVVGCTNIPLGTEIIVDVKPANGPTIRVVALNNAGSQASSTATVQVQMPRGGGTIQAKAISGIQLAANDDPKAERNSIAQTGWTADGERFKAVEVTAGLGTACQLAYLTESGKRYTVGAR